MKIFHVNLYVKFLFDATSTIDRIIHDYLLCITHFVKIQSINNKTNFKHLKILTKKIVQFFLIFLQIIVKFAHDFQTFITHDIFNNLFKSIDIKIYFEIQIKNIFIEFCCTNFIMMRYVEISITNANVIIEFTKILFIKID